MTTTTAPEPGAYPGTPMHEYATWPGASNSQLTRLMRSPAHLRAYLEEPSKDTPALVFGRAAHAAILEPDLFASTYIEQPAGLDRRTKAGKELWAELCDEYGEDRVLSPTAYRACLGMRDSVHAMRRAAGMLTGPGEVELSCGWDMDGVRCKGRFDRHSPEIAGGAVVDLKTTNDASRLGFERSIFSYGYHRQAAMYLAGARALGIPARHYVIIAVEKEPPYGVGVFRLTEGAVDAGAQQLRPLLSLYARLQEIPRTEWWGYPDEVRDVSLPAYAWNQLDDQMEDVA